MIDAESTVSDAPGTTTGDTDILAEARRRFDIGTSQDTEERALALDDLRFVNGKQWPEALERQRFAAKRPCLTINKLPGFIDQVVGDQRQNRPAIKVHPIDSNGDPDIAKIFEGMIRNIESCSQADVSYDTSFESAVGCGRGFFRIINQYADEMSFDQELRIKRIVNAFSVTWDPNASEVDLSDAQWFFITDKISREEFAIQFPGKTATDFETADGDMKIWVDENTVRIAEYWRKVPEKKTIYLYADGKVEDKKRKGKEPLLSRETTIEKIEWMVMSGTEILEGPHEWIGKHIPIIPVWGKEMYIEGNRTVRGLVRFAKDPQRMYNYTRTKNAEVIGLTPNVPWLVTKKMIDGFETHWDVADSEAKPYLIYNPDSSAPSAKPERVQPIQQQTGLVEEQQISNDEMKATTGIYDASLGNRSNETSGVAIANRQREGDIATFAYIDNLSRALNYAGRILVDLIPKIYNKAQIVRTQDIDGTKKMVPINTPVKINPQTKEIVTNPQEEAVDAILNDMSVGKYDVTVKTGPSYTTQRLEAAQTMTEYVSAVPDLLRIGGDIMFGNMDFPGADKLAKRMKLMLPPEIQAFEEQDEGETGEMPGPEAAAGAEGQQPQQPDPEQMMALEQGKMRLRTEEVRAQREEELLNIAKIEKRKKLLEFERLAKDAALPAPIKPVKQKL